MDCIKDIFKIPIYVEKLSLNNDDIKNYCYSLKDNDIEGRVISNVGGWQSKDLEGIHLPLNDLFKEIINHSSLFMKEIQLKNYDNIKIDNIWININGFKDSNNMHTHPNTLISGVYYVNSFENAGNLNFNRDAIMTYDWNKRTIETLNEYNSYSFFVKPVIGNLILFPSWLSHSVSPNQSQTQERISISFNIVYE
jgi:uncharacterized protein (TIGR02466 family)